MLKFLFIILFIIPVCLLKKRFWTVQNLVFFSIFFFILFLNFNNYFYNLSYFLGVDLISYSLILLRLWICGLIIISSELVFKNKNYTRYFNLLILFLLLILILTFRSLNLFLFYVFFESRLIPTLFLILGWGYQPERLQAGVYLLFYTLLASLPLLMSIFYILNSSFTLSIFLLTNYRYYYFYFYFTIVLAFLVKMPMFLVHLWLPKAHVEAPVSGSIILAGILLKLGGYGLVRVFPIILLLGQKYNYIFISISLVGGFLIRLVCLRQIDIKSLIAYSSVAHIGIVLRGLITLSYWGLVGSLVLIIAHGLCSSGLFRLANISYERLRSRRLIINKGLLNFIPRLSLWWFLLCSGNMAAPPTLNLLGEISLLNRIIGWSWYSIIFLSLLSFFGAAYSLYLYSYRQQGKVYSALFSFSINYRREFLVLFLHWFPLNYLILKSDICILWI